MAGGGLRWAAKRAYLELVRRLPNLTTLLHLPLEERSWLFLLRFAAFSLLIAAILGKNFGKSSGA